jgi:methylmalonyl-CoA mutase, C-terminal domain
MGRIQSHDVCVNPHPSEPINWNRVMPKRKTRVLIAKAGLDGHDRGAKIVARTLKDAGMEVIYTGLRQSVVQVVSAAVQEDVDVVGLSFLAGDHLVLLPKIVQGLKEQGKEDVIILVGGIILRRHVPRLKALGVNRVFLPGTPPEEIVRHIQASVSH